MVVIPAPARMSVASRNRSFSRAGSSATLRRVREPSRARTTTSIVGRPVLRRDGLDKAAGAARYVADLAVPGVLWGATVRSTVPCGEVARVRLGQRPAGLVVAGHRDIPGRNVVALIEEDQPALVERQVRHAAEPILLLAHESREQVEQARAAVRIDYRPGTPLLDPERSTHAFKTVEIRRGDPSAAFSRADLVVEGTYRTGAQEHAPIETNGMLAIPAADGLRLVGSLQCPFFVRRAVSVALGLPPERVRVVQAETGGGFGGKEDYPSLVAVHAALLARKAGRPVRILYGRREDMWATTKRHPSIVRHRTALRRDGRIVAMEVDILLDGGAYATLSPVVLSRAAIHATGPYRCDHVHVTGRVVRTNSPPAGAFRGFGAPQVQFAVEVHMDRMAQALGMDPVRLRALNVLRPGDRTATGQIVGRDGGGLRVLKEALRRSGFRRRRARIELQARLDRREGREDARRRGVGLALYFHGAGFTGAGESRLASRVSVDLVPGGARVRVGATELGQGARTVLAQIAAEALSLPFARVVVADVDTALVPDSGPTVASRTTMVVGELVRRCAREIRRRLGRSTPTAYLRRHGRLTVTRAYASPPGYAWDDATCRGDAYAAFAWGCHVAEVEVDPDTREVRPVRITVAADVGRAIHPLLVRGQLEGGTAQGIGWALLERVVLARGAMANTSLADYAVPSALDVPPIDVVIVERPHARGPFGAKGVGELPLSGPAPALANALRHAGFDVRQIPAVPEALSRMRCA